MDNIFVFALLFSYFAVPLKYQHKLLFWGILGALVMRLALHEALLGRSVFLLAGSLLVGFVCGQRGRDATAGFFVTPAWTIGSTLRQPPRSL